MGRKCPHPDVATCPLYHAAHVPNAGGCFSQLMDVGLCAVDLGARYEDLRQRLEIEHPQIVADYELVVLASARTLH